MDGLSTYTPKWKWFNYLVRDMNSNLPSWIQHPSSLAISLLVEGVDHVIILHHLPLSSARLFLSHELSSSIFSIHVVSSSSPSTTT